MDILGYSLGLAGTLTGLSVLANFMGVRLVRESEERDHPTVDFGALEGDMQNFATELNNTHRKDAA